MSETKQANRAELASSLADLNRLIEAGWAKHKELTRLLAAATEEAAKVRTKLAGMEPPAVDEWVRVTGGSMYVGETGRVTKRSEAGAEVSFPYVLGGREARAFIAARDLEPFVGVLPNIGFGGGPPAGRWTARQIEAALSPEARQAIEQTGSRAVMASTTPDAVMAELRQAGVIVKLGFTDLGHAVKRLVLEAQEARLGL